MCRRVRHRHVRRQLQLAGPGLAPPGPQGRFAGIRDGRDEVLEAALREILGRTVPPAEIETLAPADRK
ncbi:MAG: hypothetical protein ABI759_30460 [Candidatus Solibacter sp.]